MKFQLFRLCGIASLAAVGAAADAATCVDCETPLVANADWSNGVLAEGNYYQPTKTGNWLLGRSTNGEGQLELRSGPAVGNYVWNLCPKGHSGYCRVYIAQLVSVQAGVTYDFSFQFSMDGVRSQANTLEMSVSTLPGRARLFGEFIYSGNTNGWATFNTGTWTPTESAEVLLTLTWRNDPNDATVRIKSAGMSPVECRNPESTKTCSAEPELPATTTTSTSSTSTPEPQPTTTSSTSLTSSEPELTFVTETSTVSTSESKPTTTTTTAEGTTSTSVTSAEATTTAPPRGCNKRRRRQI